MSKTKSKAANGADTMAATVVGGAGGAGRSVAGAGAVGVEPVEPAAGMIDAGVVAFFQWEEFFELDRVPPWLATLGGTGRRLVRARAGLSWSRLAHDFGISVGQVRHRWTVRSFVLSPRPRMTRSLPARAASTRHCAVGLAKRITLRVDALGAYTTVA